MKTNHIVLDLETLGTNRNAPILSIGMVVISDLEIKATYYVVLDVIEQEQLFGRKADAATEKWWREQLETTEGRVAWNASTNNPKSVQEALGSIPQILSFLGDFNIWGNSNTFDNEILRSLMEAANLPTWSFRKDRDFRTLRALFKEKVPEPEFQGIRHVAVDDAMHEARYLIQILKYIEAH